MTFSLLPISQLSAEPVSLTLYQSEALNHDGSLGLPTKGQVVNISGSTRPGTTSIVFSQACSICLRSFHKVTFFSSGALKMQTGPDQGALPNSFLAQEHLLSA